MTAVLRGVWGLVRRYWLVAFIPAATFVVAAMVTREVILAGRGVGASKFRGHYESAFATARRGDFETALEEFRRSAEHADPDDAESQLRLANAFGQLGHRELAIEHYERAVRAAPPHPGNIARVVITYCSQGRLDDAERLFREAMASQWPDAPETHFCRGLIALHRGREGEGLEEALRCFEETLRADPSHQAARYQYGVCASRLGMLAESENALRTALEERPEDKSVYHELAGVLRRQGKTEEARGLLEKFTARDSTERRVRHLETQAHFGTIDAAGLLELGDLYLALDQAQKAHDALAQYVRKAPTDPRGRHKLAEAYGKLGLWQEAEPEKQLGLALESKARAEESP